MRRSLAFLSLFTSLSTLVCCALPALFVGMGFGAAFAGIVGSLPQLIWLSENKTWIFGIGAVLLAAGGLLQWQAQFGSCPSDPELAAACSATRDWSRGAYLFSVIIFLIGAFFAFAAPIIFS